MMKEKNRINKMSIPGLQNYYQLEMGIIPSEKDIKNTIKRISSRNKDVRE